MFNFFKSKPSPTRSILAGKSKTESLTLKLSGLHCTSCAVNIDLALEDFPGVKSTTNYAKSECHISYDSTKTNLNQIKSIINELGYQILSLNP